MSRKIWGIIILLFGAILSSCASNPKYEGTANLTGLIVDEFNQPVYGFPVSASSGVIFYETVATNESGIFMIPNVSSGNISFSGKKEGYSILDVKETFYQRDKIICFQVSTVDSVLDMVDEMISREDYGAALRELRTIHARVGSPIHDVVREYVTACESKLAKNLQNKRAEEKKSEGE